MRRMGLAAVVAVTSIGLVLTPGAAQASAAATVGAMVGSGTFTPGLTLAGTPGQAVAFGGNFVVSPGAGIYTCRSNDTADSIGSYAAGAGGGTIQCVAFGGWFTYTRTGNVVDMVGAWTSGPMQGSFTAGCLLTWTSFNTAGVIISFDFVCTFTNANANP